MDKKLIVSLLKKDIHELDLLTEGFMEMSDYPNAILALANQKIHDIEAYLLQLSEKNTTIVTANAQSAATVADVVPAEPQSIHNTEELMAEVLPPVDVVNEMVEPVEVDALDEITEPVPAQSELVEVETTTVEFEVVDSTETVFTTVVETTSVDTEPTTETVVTTTETTTETVIETVTETKELKTVIDETRKTILGERNMQGIPSRNEVLMKADNSLSATIANRKIDDIKQAINIGDRFRFQRELFKANGEDMNKTLNYLNQLATLEEALAFLKSKYSWEAANETAEDFFQLVRRKFL